MTSPAGITAAAPSCCRCRKGSCDPLPLDGGESARVGGGRVQPRRAASAVRATVVVQARHHQLRHRLAPRLEDRRERLCQHRAPWCRRGATVTASLSAAEVLRRQLAAADDGKPKPPLAKRGSGRHRCRRWRRELRLCVPGSQEWFCDFWDHRRSLWLFLPSPENPASKGGSWGCRRTGSETAAVSVQPFLWFESLWLLRKRFGAEVLVAGILIVDFGSRRKGRCDAFELWNLRFEVGALSENYSLLLELLHMGTDVRYCVLGDCICLMYYLIVSKAYECLFG
ncbi:uncharacterized protein DS421_11g329820 [Arachis hypogaea]|nr:uncharacterized protein DS421_11g329820 [Arachis hypogaea]